MQDQITINLRALDEEARLKIEMILEKQLGLVPDETNEDALDVIRLFKED